MLRLRTADDDVLAGLDRIRTEFAVPGAFPAAALAEAEAAAAAPPPALEDLREVPFFTLDPAGSMDLDQAMWLERRPGGHRVRYAIADVAHFVRPGGALDAEAHERGVTLYLPDVKAPLHPPALSEGAGSLLPGADRPAAVWTIDLDEAGLITDVDVRRALVRSRDRLAYTGASTADPRIALLCEVGRALLAAEAARGGVSLPLPEQEVVHGWDGWTLEQRGDLAAEEWNAQISLLAGRAAAALMLDGGVGLLRTMPPAPAEAVAKLRRAARALGVDWPDDRPYGEVMRGLNPARAKDAALLYEAPALMRGAGYTAFDGERPASPEHAAVAAPYAHVTAPIRRLADRFATEVCLALAAGRPVPGWAREALPGLPEVMRRSLRRAGDVERACVDLVESLLLSGHVGEVFDAVVVEANEGKPGGLVQLAEPAVLAKCEGEGLPLGRPVKVRLREADPSRRLVRFALTG
ncbi:RNB domain-containing ribonuclease [Actinomadura sp. PM05-2]|uniref:RNB domain-containing ribonuclease n=2 Tax=Actinomadura parmotrematis TaxID=2864039 RepID=A0ABS7FSV9_9ACTN|nr:RNB domain-containing ribonuclease [Actinomadura parmotrematis]